MNTPQSIYKYPLPINDWVSVAMPEGAEPLCVHVQHGVPCLWARVPVAAKPVIRHFRIAGTGHDLGSNVGEHIGSFLLHDGGLVFHVFAESEVKA